MTVEASTKLPERNPAHTDALNMGDLSRGMKISWNTVHCSGNRHIGIVFGEPFVRGDSQMITVVAKDHTGEVSKQDWNLGDMGAYPYLGSRGPRWNPLNYTLEVKD